MHQSRLAHIQRIVKINRFFPGPGRLRVGALHSGQIYEAALSLEDFPLGINQLFRDEERLTLGRWPNLDAGEARLFLCG